MYTVRNMIMPYCNAFTILHRKESPLIVRREQKTIRLPRANQTFSQRLATPFMKSNLNILSLTFLVRDN